MSRSPITIDADGVGQPDEWLHNAHAGEMLLLEFMEPLEMSAATLAQAIDIEAERLSAVINGARPLAGSHRSTRRLKRPCPGSHTVLIPLAI